MKMWSVAKGAQAELFVFEASGRLLEVRRPYTVPRTAQYDDHEVIDYVRVHNNERQAFSNYSTFPSHLYPAPVRTILTQVQDHKGCAIVRKGKQADKDRTYVLVLAQGEYDCMC